MTAPLESILKEFSVELKKVYGSRLKAIRLFGSHARGEAVSGSDIDIALVLDRFSNTGEEVNRTVRLTARISLKHDCVISLIPIREEDWRIRQTPFLMNLRRESIAIA